MIVWIIGLPGSGKTTLAYHLMRNMAEEGCCSNPILLDGDQFREMFDNDLGYSIFDRKKNIKRVRNICKWLENQTVFCAVNSMFESDRKWCYQNILNFQLVYIKRDYEKLFSENKKFLYGLGSQSQILNDFEEVERYDYVYDNNGDLAELLKFGDRLLEKWR